MSGFLGFFVVACIRLAQSAFLQRPDQRPLPRESTRNDSIDTFSTGNASGSWRLSCSYAGPSWNPLQDCLPGFSGVLDVKKSDVKSALGNNLLCKLKKDLHFKVWAAWSEAAAQTAFHEVVNTSHGNGSASKHRLDRTLSHREPLAGAGDEKKSTHGGDQHSDATESSVHVNKMDDFFKQNRSTSNGSMFHYCSVVSNSGVLRLYHHGQTIDSSHMVLRFNDAPLQHWSEYVGVKDDMRIVNNQFPDRVLQDIMTGYDFQPHTLFGLLPFSRPVTPRLQTLRAKHPTAKIRILSDSIMDAFEATLRHMYHADWFDKQGVSFKPTTGAMGMLSALVACDEVRAFGMAASPASANAPYHYYGEGARPELSAGENSWHKTFRAEKDLWRRIARNPGAEIDATDIALIPGFHQVHCP